MPYSPGLWLMLGQCDHRYYEIDPLLVSGNTHLEGQKEFL